MPTQTLPEHLTFQAGGEIDIQAAKDGNSKPKFTMLAYTGGLMKVAGFELPVVVDLAGLKIERQNTPIRLNHDINQGVGHTNKVTNTGTELTASGIISRDTPWARDVASSGKGGFPWQASIGAGVGKYRYVPESESVTVNGQTFQGEFYHVTESKLIELSFVESGADGETAAEIHANQNHFFKERAYMPRTAVEAKNEELTAENSRLEAIVDLCGDDTELRVKASKENWPVSRVEGYIEANNERVLAELRASRATTPAGGYGKNIQASNTQVLEASLLMRTGNHAAAEKGYSEQVLEAAHRSPQHAMEIVATCLRLEGKPVPTDKRELVEAGFSTMSLPGVLSNVAHKALLSSYNAAPGIHKRICKKRPVSNFKENTLYRPDLAGGLDKMGADGEIKHTTMREADYKIKAETYSKMLRITRQMAINDDLHVFEELPVLFGRNARRTQSDVFAELLLSGDGTFFSAGNENYISGAGSALSVAGVGTAIKYMRKQRDEENNDLDIQPTTLVVPPELEVDAIQILESEYIQRIATAADLDITVATGNALRKAVGLGVDSRLSNDAKFTNASSLAWYLFASQEDMAMSSCYLNGNENPIIEYFGLSHDANTLGMSWRCYIDFGFAFGDYRAAFKSKGQA